MDETKTETTNPTLNSKSESTTRQRDQSEQKPPQLPPQLPPQPPQRINLQPNNQTEDPKSKRDILKLYLTKLDAFTKGLVMKKEEIKSLVGQLKDSLMKIYLEDLAVSHQMKYYLNCLKVMKLVENFVEKNIDDYDIKIIVSKSFKVLKKPDSVKYKQYVNYLISDINQSIKDDTSITFDTRKLTSIKYIDNLISTFALLRYYSEDLKLSTNDWDSIVRFDTENYMIPIKNPINQFDDDDSNYKVIFPKVYSKEGLLAKGLLFETETAKSTTETADPTNTETENPTKETLNSKSESTTKQESGEENKKKDLYRSIKQNVQKGWEGSIQNLKPNYITGDPKSERDKLKLYLTSNKVFDKPVVVMTPLKIYFLVEKLRNSLFKIYNNERVDKIENEFENSNQMKYYSNCRKVMKLVEDFVEKIDDDDIKIIVSTYKSKLREKNKYVDYLISDIINQYIRANTSITFETEKPTISEYIHILLSTFALLRYYSPRTTRRDLVEVEDVKLSINEWGTLVDFDQKKYMTPINLLDDTSKCLVLFPTVYSSEHLLAKGLLFKINSTKIENPTKTKIENSTNKRNIAKTEFQLLKEIIEHIHKSKDKEELIEYINKLDIETTKKLLILLQKDRKKNSLNNKSTVLEVIEKKLKNSN
jgi:hypothetical protein